jgi:hypothetical protein
MEDLISEQTKDLLDKEKIEIASEKPTLCVRFLRKKYKCVMLWMLSIIAFSQLLVIMFDKIFDEEVVNILSKKITHYFNSTLKNSSN